jgi:hypothetical protein
VFSSETNASRVDATMPFAMCANGVVVVDDDAVLVEIMYNDIHPRRAKNIEDDMVGST